MTLPDYAIEARGLVKTSAATKTTPEMHALRGVDLVSPRGSIFGLLGPNGAGKSTFINILAGLCKKTSGKVSIWGRDIDARPRDARAAIGVVPQEIAADPFFTPKEALEVTAGMYAVPTKERRTMELLTAPPVLRHSPARMLMKVDLPAPLGPKRPKIDPRGTSRSTPESAVLAGVVLVAGKVLTRPLASMA